MQAILKKIFLFGVVLILLYSAIFFVSLSRAPNEYLIGVFFYDDLDYKPASLGLGFVPYPYRSELAKIVLDNRENPFEFRGDSAGLNTAFIYHMAKSPDYLLDGTSDFTRVENYKKGLNTDMLNRAFDYLESRGMGVDHLIGAAEKALHGCTVLQYAIRDRDLTAVKFLLGRGASLRTDLDAVEPKTHKLGCDRSVPDLAREYLPEALPYLLATEGENQSVH